MSPQEYFENLRGAEYMSLTTFRKTGAAVPTPVWFAVVSGKLYVMTDPGSGKIKRIINNPCVSVAPASMRGELKGRSVEARVRILPPEEHAAAEAALKRKYGWKMGFFDRLGKLMRRSRQSTYLEITAP